MAFQETKRPKLSYRSFATLPVLVSISPTLKKAFKVDTFSTHLFILSFMFAYNQWITELLDVLLKSYES